MEEKEIGTISHYFANIKVAVIRIEKDKLAISDMIHIKGHTSDFKQKVASMQIEHKEIDVAVKGNEIALKVKDYTRVGDRVYKILEI